MFLKRFNLLMACCIGLSSASLVFAQPKRAEKQAEDKCSTLLESPLIKIDHGTLAYKGLTKRGLEELKQARDALRGRLSMFGKEFRQMDTIHHVGLLARLFKGNMFLYGPPRRCKIWICRLDDEGEKESDPAFKLQLHQMITEQAFTGGQNFEAAKEGRFEINAEGSLADYTVALIDETEKGNPAALASLLSLLNERQILAGNKVIKARLETLFSTCNANLAEILQQFMENGQASTAPALLNRFQFKSMVYNWLPVEDQAALDERVQKRLYLKSLAESFPAATKDEMFLKQEALNWQSLRHIAHVLFRPSKEFMAVYRELVNDMRDQTNQAIRTSEKAYQAAPQDEMFVYFPSADYTERLRQQIPEIIMLSAFLDFLESPLANDDQLEAMTSKTIELDPISLWRGYAVMTTTGPGHARLKVNAEKIDIDFDFRLDPSKARDSREQKLVSNLKDEQERFRTIFLKHIEKLSQHIEIRSKGTAAKGKGMSSIAQGSFELMMQALSEK